MPILKNAIGENTIVVTDASRMYDAIEETHRHEVVNHAQDEFVRGEFHTNGIEGFWSLLKRGIVGVYHSISEKHTGQYVDEYAYRYNLRNSTDKNRIDMLLQNCNGRLTYNQLIKK